MLFICVTKSKSGGFHKSPSGRWSWDQKRRAHMKKILVAVFVVLVLGAGMGTQTTDILLRQQISGLLLSILICPVRVFSIEIVKAVFAAQGYTVEHRVMPWARAEHEVKNGKIDILPDTWFTKKRNTYLMFSTPYAFNRIKFIKKKGDPFEYEGIKSLTGKTIGVIRGFGYRDDFLNAKNFSREEVRNFIVNIRKLVRDRIDLTLEDEIVARSILSKAPRHWRNKLNLSLPPCQIMPCTSPAAWPMPGTGRLSARLTGGLPPSRPTVPLS